MIDEKHFIISFYNLKNVFQKLIYFTMVFFFVLDCIGYLGYPSSPTTKRPKKTKQIMSRDILYVPHNDAKFTHSLRRILVTIADFSSQIWYFWKQDFSSLLTQSIVL